MKLSEMKELLSEITYRDWKFEVRPHGDVMMFMQLSFTADGKQHKSRKWLMSVHATPSEVIQTALKAVLTAEEHEARERFQYRGRAIFGPHIDHMALWTVANHQDVRPDPER